MSFSTVLATRPEPQQSALCDHLAALVPEVVSLAAFDFEALTPPTDLPDRVQGALLIFTSPRSVTFGLAALDGALPRQASVAAIGPATNAELARHDIPSLQPTDNRYDSEALLALLDAESTPGRALIFAAPGGRQALERGLSERGWQVAMVPVYRRRLLPLDSAKIRRLEHADGILSLWTSGAAMSHVLDGLSEEALRRVLGGAAVVASERLAQLAREAGFARVFDAGGASNASLTEAVRACLDSGTGSIG